MAEVLVPFINSLIVLDIEGNRLFAKYYDGKKKPDQIAYEQTLFKVTLITTTTTIIIIIMMMMTWWFSDLMHYLLWSSLFSIVRVLDDD